ncbi:hypothetical protein CAEBREN_02137 [Caenorhabditis brenneri]|uniref:Uncharacterized protein n=1 Tax=Caenorhabditis brenneri TaxID=135651 RepID=G0MF80_CAEBE|nr:hypothetical protein CAEBREN_02137 [Caenorhabditis brenneri]
MKRTTTDQQTSFQTDYFLNQLSHFTEAKFSLFEHAPLNERRDRFRNHVEREEMPLTFCRMGINIPVKLEWYQTMGNEISFRSRPFVFNGIWVKVIGTMNSETLEGRVRFERFQRETKKSGVHVILNNNSTESVKIPEMEEEPIGMTDEEIRMLREEGLNI